MQGGPVATSFLILDHTKSFVEKIHSMDAVPIFVKCESIAWSLLNGLHLCFKTLKLKIKL